MRGLLVGLVMPLLMGGGLLLGGGAIFPVPPPTTDVAQSLPVAPATAPAVAGIPEPCFAQRPWPKDAKLSDIKRAMQGKFGLKLSGDEWTSERYRPVVKIIWETLDGINCTPYLATIKAKNGGSIALNSGPTRSWAWGDYGLTRPDVVTLDFAKLITAHQSGDDGRIVRLVIHELGHVYQKDRGDDSGYMASFEKLYRVHGKFSNYGGDSLETMSEVIGYYVARCAKDNPYDKGTSAAYYQWAKSVIFRDVEFGPAPGTKPHC